MRTDHDLETLTSEWPLWVKESGLTTIGTHIFPSRVVSFVQSDKGQAFLEACRKHGLHVEHELHAMRDLLPRSLFKKDPSMFRMDVKGSRVPEFNLCVHSTNAVDVVCQNAFEYAQILKPTTGRYFYWIDDDRPMCRCAKCRLYSDSDQALILENAMIRALQRQDPQAKLAHLAYRNTLVAPTQVKPAPGIFLEFAPIDRTWDHPLEKTDAVSWNPSSNLTHEKILDHLDANLQVFDRRSAQALEYWLDVSLFSRWKRPAKKLPWRPDVFRKDIKTYAKRGIRHVTTFAVFIDSDYIKRFGEPTPFVHEYGRGLLEYRQS